MVIVFKSSVALVFRSGFVHGYSVQEQCGKSQAQERCGSSAQERCGSSWV